MKHKVHSVNFSIPTNLIRFPSGHSTHYVLSYVSSLRLLKNRLQNRFIPTKSIRFPFGRSTYYVLNRLRGTGFFRLPLAKLFSCHRNGVGPPVADDASTENDFRGWAPAMSVLCRMVVTFCEM